MRKEKVLKSDTSLNRDIDSVRELKEEETSGRSSSLIIRKTALKNPVNVIAGYLELLQDELRGKDQLSYLHSIKESIHQLSLLAEGNHDINDSSLETNSMGKQRVFYLIGLMIGVKKRLRHHLESKGIKLILEVDEDIPPELVGDKELIEKIITNFIIDTLSYIKTGLSVLKVSCDQLGPLYCSLVFEVKSANSREEDRLSETNEQPSTFKHSVGNELKAASKGGNVNSNKLQLSRGYSSKETVERRSLKLSVKVHPTPELLTTKHNVPTQYLSMLNIIVAEEDFQNRKLIGVILTRYGANTQLASSVDEAMRFLNENTNLVVLSDNLIGTGNTVERIRKESQTPILVLSSDVGVVRNEFVQGIISKPYTPAGLVKKINQICHLSLKKSPPPPSVTADEGLRDVVSSDSTLLPDLMDIYVDSSKEIIDKLYLQFREGCYEEGMELLYRLHHATSLLELKELKYLVQETLHMVNQNRGFEDLAHMVSRMKKLNAKVIESFQLSGELSSV